MSFEDVEFLQYITECLRDSEEEDQIIPCVTREEFEARRQDVHRDVGEPGSGGRGVSSREDSVPSVVVDIEAPAPQLERARTESVARGGGGDYPARRQRIRQRSRGFCFTLNNPRDEELQVLDRIVGEVDLRTHEAISYLIFGREVGESGTRHLQGYLYFSGGQRDMSVVKRYIGNRAHVEVARGSPEQNRLYCSKDGDFTEVGEIPKGQGNRSDLEGVIKAVSERRTLAEIAQEHPLEMIKFHKGILGWRSMLMCPRNTKTEVRWFWGPTGGGKSKEAWEIATTQNSSYYYKDPLSRWWDAYDQQDVVIVDDYRPDFCTFAALLRLFDRFPLKLEFKGGIVEFNSKLIIVTTPKDPSNTWKDRSAEDIQQLLRRIEVIKFFDVKPLTNIIN